MGICWHAEGAVGEKKTRKLWSTKVVANKNRISFHWVENHISIRMGKLGGRHSQSSSVKVPCARLSRHIDNGPWICRWLPSQRSWTELVKEFSLQIESWFRRKYLSCITISTFLSHPYFFLWRTTGWMEWNGSYTTNQRWKTEITLPKLQPFAIFCTI